MDEEEVRKAIRRCELKNTLEAECLGTISDRIARYLELDFIKVTPNVVNQRNGTLFEPNTLV